MLFTERKIFPGKESFLMEQPTCLAIDLKSYYASAECAARHLDPLTTHLVVADESRTEKTICLAVSPSLKAYGLPGRARLFEVLQKLKEVNAGRLSEAIRLGRATQKNGRPSLTDSSFDSKALQADPSLKASCIIAPPRMAYYEKLSRQIYGIYLKYIAPEDIVVYSIDEVFMDVSSYLAHYRMTARQLAKKLVQEIQHATGITATAGIGTNLYLAKLAMDITAKHAKPDKEGVRIAELNEESFRYLLWDHRPLTDFWHTGPAIARRLEHHGIHTMGELARISLQYPEILYDEFGIHISCMILKFQNAVLAYFLCSPGFFFCQFDTPRFFVFHIHGIENEFLSLQKCCLISLTQHFFCCFTAFGQGCNPMSLLIVFHSPWPNSTARMVRKMIFQSTRKLRSWTYFTSRFIHSSKLKSFRCGAICQ